MTQAYQKIKDSSQNPSAAGDLSLIFGYMRLLDPASTVREGEFANAENSAGVPDTIRARYNKIISGERLAPKQRKDFVDRAGLLYKGQERLHTQRESEYRRLAKESDVDPSSVVVNLRAAPDKIRVLRPDGKTISLIPESQWEEAQKKGYKRAQ